MGVRIVLCVALVASACAGCEDAPEQRTLSCNLPQTGRQLAGAWNLTARGRRFGCDDRRLEGDLHIELSMPLEVTAEPQPTTGPGTGPETDSEADAFVLRIMRADYLLDLGADAPSEVTLEGGTVGSCVSFTLQEQLPKKDALVYDFDGYITDRGLAQGDFSGSGPEACQVEGTFHLEID